MVDESADASDESAGTPDSPPAVDLTKADSASISPDQLPSSMRLALGAAIAQVVLGLLYAALSWPLASQLHDAVIKSNKKLKKPKVLCETSHIKGCLNVDSTVHAIQRSTLLISVVISVVIVIFLPRLRRGSRSARTMYVAVTLISALIGFSASPLSIIALFSSGAAIPRIVAVLGSLTSIAAVALLFAAQSQRYFDLKSPNPLGARPGLGSLLRPRPPVPRQTERTPGLRTNPNRGDKRPQARSKSRNDADAIARGAALARNRAKASKSRRTDA